MCSEVMTVKSARVRGTEGYQCFTSGRERGRDGGEEKRSKLDFSPVEDPDRVLLCGKRK